MIQVTRSAPTWASPFSLGPRGVLFKGRGGSLGEGGRSCDPALSKSSEEQEQRALSLRPQGSWGRGGTAESWNDSQRGVLFPLQKLSLKRQVAQQKWGAAPLYLLIPRRPLWRESGRSRWQCVFKQSGPQIQRSLCGPSSVSDAQRGHL